MSTAVKVEALSAPRVVIGRLERVRRGKRTVFEATAPEPAPEPSPARVALTLALAHAIQRSIDVGETRDQADAAQKLGTTRARVTQLLDLTLLCPRIQEAVLGMMDSDVEGMSELVLREICRHESWRLQQETPLPSASRSSAWRRPA